MYVLSLSLSSTLCCDSLLIIITINYHCKYTNATSLHSLPKQVRARKGIHYGSTLDGAVTWIGEHENDDNIDLPFLVKKSEAVPKVPLTEEEKAGKYFGSCVFSLLLLSY